MKKQLNTNQVPATSVDGRLEESLPKEDTENEIKTFREKDAEAEVDYAIVDATGT